MNITEEIIEAIAPLVRRHHCQDETCAAERDREARDLAEKIATALAPLIAAQALREKAEEIRRELVCCDVYERVGPELQARNLAGENVEVSDKTTAGHQICYWGEAAAVLVEP